MTYTCAKSYFFKYSLSLYTLSVFLSPITQLSRFLFLFRCLLVSSSLGFLYGSSFLPSPSRGDYCFRYVDSIHLIYNFFVPQHKNEFFFGFSHQSFVFFMFLLFLCFFVVHMVDSVFFCYF